MSARAACLAFAALLAGVVPARAGEGVNLSWDDCGAHGVAVRTFACHVNTGIESLIGSFRTGRADHQLAGVSFTLDLVSDSAQLPEWWELRNGAGLPVQCRNGSAGANADFAQGPGSCYDTFRGIAFGALDGFEPAAGGVNRARLTGSFVAPALDPEPYPEDKETYAFRLLINHAKSVGTACGGCPVPVCIQLAQLVVMVGPGEPDRVLTQPIERSFVHWQDSPSLCAVGARRPTWGAIKSLYR